MVSRVAGTVTLFLLTALIAVRPLITETYDSAESSIDWALEALTNPTPLRTLILDGLILAAALVVVLAISRVRAIRLPRLIKLGFLILVLAGVVSCAFAGNKRLAINATIDWLCLPILALTLIPLLCGPWQRRLLLAAIVGSASVQALECYEQYTYGFADTAAQYERHKDEFWRSQGVAPDDPKVELFESRMNAREVSGFMAHSNVVASYFLMVAFGGFGLCAERLRRWRTLSDPWQLGLTIMLVLLTKAVVVVMPLTGSRGAMVAGFVALASGLLCYVGGRFLQRHRRRVFVGSWIAFALLAAGTVGHGVYHKSLPGVSLTFRWQYWTASAEMVADHPWTGVGRENFGRNYLRYKSIKSPEEVSTPHNLFVQAAVDWGLPGLVGMVLLLVGGSRAVVLGRRGVRLGANDDEGLAGGSDDVSLSGAARVGIFAALTLIILGTRVPWLGSDNPDFVYYKTMTGGLAWLLGAGAVWFSAEGHRERSGVRRSERTIATMLAWGLLAFLLHDMISFALFVPATATTFFAVAAYILSVRSGSGEHSGIVDGPCVDPQTIAERFEANRTGAVRTKTIGLSGRYLGLLLVFCGAFVGYGLVPAARSGAYLARARRLTGSLPVTGRVSRHPALVAFEQAAKADRWDPTPLAEQGRWLAAIANAYPDLASDTLDLAVDSIQRAIVRDPVNSGPVRTLQSIYLMRAGMTGRRDDYAHAIKAARDALALYPQDPRGLVRLADTLAQAGDALNDPALLRQAVEAYEAALSLDDQRIEWETLRRFRPKERAAIQEKTRKIVGEIDQ